MITFGRRRAWDDLSGKPKTTFAVGHACSVWEDVPCNARPLHDILFHSPKDAVKGSGKAEGKKAGGSLLAACAVEEGSSSCVIFVHCIYV